MAEERATAEFAVGHAFQADIFLQLDHVPDRAVLDLVQLGFPKSSCREACGAPRSARSGATGCRYDRREKADVDSSSFPCSRHACDAAMFGDNMSASRLVIYAGLSMLDASVYPDDFVRRHLPPPSCGRSSTWMRWRRSDIQALQCRGRVARWRGAARVGDRPCIRAGKTVWSYARAARQGQSHRCACWSTTLASYPATGCCFAPPTIRCWRPAGSRC